MVSVNDLGGLGLDGVPVGRIVRSGLQRQLLAALVLSHPDRVGTDRLFELLWPGTTGEPRRVWTHVYRLRRTLDAHGGGLSISSRDAGYALVGSLVLDSRRFEDLVARAEGLTDAAPSDAVAALDEALGLWRGRPYGDLDIERFAPGWVPRLDERRQRASLLRARLLLTTADPRDVVGELEHLVADQPYDEDAVELLVSALYRSGRQVETLRRVSAFRTALVSDVGVDLSPRLVDLESRMLAHDPSLGPAPAPETGAAPARLPRWRTPFVGREDACGRLAALVEETRLITVSGPAGVGKTRLAVEAVGQLAADDGHRFADLAVTSDPASLDDVVAAACGLRERDARPSLLAHLRRGRPLLVLDNCEHLLHAVAPLVDEILDQTDGVRVIATSREQLRIAGETVLHLAPLAVGGEDSLGPAELLFCELAGLSTDTLSAAERRLVHDVCTRLDGLPLGIELAAARAGAIGLVDLAAGLDNRFGLLTTGNRTAPDRHQTLRAAIDWSFDQLPTSHQHVLSGCSTFVGRFTLDDATAVCADEHIGPGDVRAAVADLVDRNLVEHTDDRVPYRLLETLREYGRERLDAGQERSRWSRRHAEHFTRRAQALAADAFGPNEVAAVDAMLAQADEFRAALQWARAEHEWQLLADLMWGIATTTFFLSGAWIEPVRIVEDLAFTRPEPLPRRWSTVVAAIASTLWNRSMLEEAERATAHAIELDPSDVEAWVQAAFVASQTDAALATDRAEEALRLSRPDRPEELLPALNVLAQATAMAGQRDRSLQVADRLVAEAERFGTASCRSFGESWYAFNLPWGSPEGAIRARRAHVLARSSSRASVMQVWSAVLHVCHLLGHDPDAARSALLDYLRPDRAGFSSDAYPDVYWGRLLGSAAAYFAMVGRTAAAREIGSVVGPFFVPDFTGYAAVDELRATLPDVEVSSIETHREELEELTARTRSLMS